jgi:phage shock protein A
MVRIIACLRQDKDPVIVFPDLDAAYRRQLETQTRVRRAVATVATSRKRLQVEIGRLEQGIGERGGQGRAEMETGHDSMPGASEAVLDTAGARLAELRRQYAAIQAQEERVAVASTRLQVEINTFRDARKTIEAAYTAAEEAAEAVLAEATGAVPAARPSRAGIAGIERHQDDEETGRDQERGS